MVCEKLRSSADETQFDPRTGAIVGGLGLPYTIQQSIDDCASLQRTPGGIRTQAGLCWLVGTLSNASYNHTIAPNNSLPDCQLPALHPSGGCFGARSNHPGIVNLGMADGSVRVVRNGVDPAVWLGLGTRASGEMISANQY